LDDRWLSVDILPGEVVAPGKCQNHYDFPAYSDSFLQVRLR
jgi:hypothetical protein